ncbi:putative pectinesterase [Helianthus annuus]|nr:putative pectinesterase [Helianthus annuus]KAJ0882603.1 putative pectinesterase [Helianthus annuus]
MVTTFVSSLPTPMHTLTSTLLCVYKPLTLLIYFTIILTLNLQSMASTTTIFSILILLTYAATTATSQPPSSSSTVCQSTPYPSFCQTTLPINNSSATIYDYGRLSIRKSITAASKFANSIDKYLSNSPGLTTGTIRALQDCQYLAKLNIEYLSNAFATVNTTQTTLSDTKSEDIQTILSAILTNTETCIDGLQSNAASWTSKNGVVSPIKNDNKLYSVSLALVNKGWGSKKSKKFRVSHKHKGLEAISETVGRRKLLQVDGTGNQVVVSQDGSGNFTTITDAINFAPNNTSPSTAGYFVVYVTAGVYEEYVNIPKNKKNLMMIGDGINQTVITGNRSVVDGWTTFNSATFIVVAPNFVAMNLTIRNTAGAIKHQAVALRSGADLSTFYKCSFEGYQDTLYAHSLRQFYRECDIYGTVDFIFGNAATVLQNCNLYPRLPMSGQFNAITAQGRTDPGQNTGTSIQKCNIRAADDLAASNGTTVTYLGRPWKEYSRTVYMQSFMDSLIAPAGWSVWSGDFALNTSYYAEFNNSGPGSDTSQRVTWPGFHVINETDAVSFTVSGFIVGDAWLNQTGVPYDAGL